VIGLRSLVDLPQPCRLARLRRGNTMSNVVRLRESTGIPISSATLDLHARRLKVPNYDRSALTRSVVHIGVGGFHRAHQGSYFDDLARDGNTGWGVTGMGLHSRKMKQALEPQDCLYTVVERGPDRADARVIGSLCGYHFTPDDHAAAVDALAHPSTRLVTLTITGDGYCRDALTGDFDAECPSVRDDLTRPGHYATAWAYIVEALGRRQRMGRAPFTVMSCDNLPDNGGAARRAVVGFAAQRSAELAQWIEHNVAFPSTMVDRITPKTTDAEKALVAQDFGVIDRWPVIAEPFRQWIVEDAFCNGRPPLEDVGVDVVNDIGPYKLAKARLLNGTHSAISYLGLLLGHETTDMAMRDPLVYRYVEQLMRVEVSPLVPRNLALDLVDYRASVLERLSNPGVADKLTRLAARGSTKMPSYLLPSLREGRGARRPTTLLTLALAAWFRYLRGYDMQGRSISIEDHRAGELKTLALAGLTDPRPLLGFRDIFGDLGDDVEFVDTFKQMLHDIDRTGLAAVIRKVITAESGRQLQEGRSRHATPTSV
jgi:mannitol 2-dehydrogenase